MAGGFEPGLIDEAVKTIQMLAVDGVEKAASGHPGAPMGQASMAVALWTTELRFDPAAPDWPNRDRFVLSCGHASMLLYGLLHLSGYDLSLADLGSFRQWGSKTPGHPEVHLTPGVEMTTGPLGQGIATAVGMAAGLKMLAARLDPHEPGLFDARVFGIASDGDLMEGLSAEACSLAGHLGLDNLVFFYDDNRISIDGDVGLSFSEDVALRFEAQGWFAQRVDGHDHEAIVAALGRAVAEPARPSLIIARTHIGKGSPNRQDTAKCHGEPLGAAEVAATKKSIGWPLTPTFLVPDRVRALFAERAAEGAARRQQWLARRDRLLARGGEAAPLFRQLLGRAVPDDLLERLLALLPRKDSPTRTHSGALQQTVAALVPSLVGGSADLTSSTKTWIEGGGVIRRGDFAGRNLHFGIREHAMGAFLNGVTLAGGFIPYGATFLMFSDYLRPALRLAALSRLPVVLVFTHDSLYLGEDGPTHQPVEHFWALRTIPNLDLVRPADATECAYAWAHALGRRDGPTAFALTRQKVPELPRPSGFEPRSMLRGAYVIDETAGAPTAIVVATGSEVAVAIAAKRLLGPSGEKLRIVSAPCWDALERQDAAYREALMPAGVKRCTIELGLAWPWRGVAGLDGLVIGHDDFGHSAPWEELRQRLGFTPEAIAARIGAWL